jgi:mannose-6-phosphate isomerase-like protein (cupin superfamily)
MKQEQFDFFFCSRTWVKTDRYEGNYLSWKQGFEVPWQYDRGRDKSLFLDVGKIKLILQSDADLLEERILQAGDCCHIPRGKKYTILACQESEILAVSTSEAQDVVLVEDRKAFVPLLCEPKKPLYIQKPWGFELIWAQTEGYVGKVLHIEKGHQLSLQYHRVKNESVRLLRGKMLLVLQNASGVFEEILMDSGTCSDILPMRKHRMIALETCEVFEVSTPELEDVVRLEDQYGRVR